MLTLVNMENSIVCEWLKSLNMSQYSEAFIDNGYDDLEICKKISAPDLDAIGVVNLQHRSVLLSAVQSLKHEGAASVYFRVEAPGFVGDTIDGNNFNSKDILSPTESVHSSNSRSSYSHSDIGNSEGKIKETSILAGTPVYGDNYEASRAELVRFSKSQLCALLQENLIKDGINLALYPYTQQDGQTGTLEGLASRYAEKLNTHYQDVIEYLDQLRLNAWEMLCSNYAHSPNDYIEQSPVLSDLDSQAVYEFSSGVVKNYSFLPHVLASIDSSFLNSQAIYMPGKYNPSSCLSDAEEEEIYGYAGGHHIKSSRGSAISKSHGCLNPRSHGIYELPPSGELPARHNGIKKRLGIGRILKTLRRDFRKTVQSKKNANYAEEIPIKKIDSLALSATPLVGLPGYSSPASSRGSRSSHSHSSHSHSSNHSVLPTSTSVPGTPSCNFPRDSGLQDAIERLKEREIIQRREEQYKEHEQILHDLQQRLKETAKENPKYVLSNYQEIFTDRVEKGCCQIAEDSPYHWYDEPPYESDPEEFLLCMNSLREQSNSSFGSNLKEDVISLRTAGDISLPRDSRKQVSLQLPILPIHHLHGFLSDNAPHDNIQYTLASAAQKEYSTNFNNCNNFMQNMKTESTESCSSQDSSGYSLSKTLQNYKNMQKRMLVMQSPNQHSHGVSFYTCSRGQQLVPSQLTGSSLITENMGSVTSPVLEKCIVGSLDSDSIPAIGYAIAVVDFNPSSCNKFLKFKKGDVIEILEKRYAGTWIGRHYGNIGYFKCAMVQECGQPQPLKESSSNMNKDTVGQYCDADLSYLLQAFNLSDMAELKQALQLKEEDFKNLGIYESEVSSNYNSTCVLKDKIQKENLSSHSKNKHVGLRCLLKVPFNKTQDAQPNEISPKTESVDCIGSSESRTLFTNHSGDDS